MKQGRWIWVLVVLFICAGYTGTSMAGEDDDWMVPGEEKFKITGGAFLSNFDTNLRVDSKTLGEGTDISLEDDLNFDDSTYTYHVGGYWRIANRHRLAGGYFVFDRDSSATLNTDIQVGDETFPAGAGVSSEFNLKIIPVSYAYSFINNEKHEFSGLIGLHWNKVEFKMSGFASAGVGTVFTDVTADADAPLPMIGLAYEHRFSKRWTAGVAADAFYLDASGSTFAFKGSLLSLGVNTEYWLFKNLGVGAAVSYFKLDADVEDDEWKGEFDYQYWGPRIYAIVRF